MEIGKFGCNPATVSAISAPHQSGASNRMLIQGIESGNVLTGYAGNALNFRFENHSKSEKFKREVISKERP
jgi:hypothetical protein